MDYQEYIRYSREYENDINKLETIGLGKLLDKTFCGENTIYSNRGIVLLYNQDDELLAINIIFNQIQNESSIYKIVTEHNENADYYNGWYKELSYAKFLSLPYHDPMDLIILSIGFDLLYLPKYKKKTNYNLKP